MAILDFDGVDDYVQSASLGLDLTGAFSVLAVIKRDAIGSFQAIVSNNVAAGTPAVVIEFNTADKLVYEINNGGGTSVSTTAVANTTDTWFVAYTKPAGTTAGRFHFKNLTTLAATVHEAGSTALGAAPSQAGGNLKIGNYGATLADDFNGQIALLAEFDFDLSDAQIDTILTTRRTSAIYALSPKLLAQCDRLRPIDQMGLTTFNAATGAALTGANPTNWLLDGDGHTPAFVKSLGVAGSGASANPLVLTVPAGGVPIGDVICFSGEVSNTGSFTVTDSKGNVYTILQSLVATTSWMHYIGTCPVTVALAAGDTISFNYSTGTHKCACADQFTGVSNTVDVTPTATSGATTAVSQSTTTVNPDDLLWTAVSSFVAATPAPTLALTDAVNWTKTNEHESGSGRGQCTVYRVVNAAGTYTMAGTLSATPTIWQEGTIALKASGGAPAPFVFNTIPGRMKARSI